MDLQANPIASLPPRERILVAAHDLFYSDGIRATGIDRIIERSAVSKVTFYRQYASKDELIRAYLDHRHQRWMTWFKNSLAQESAAGADASVALLRTLKNWFSSPSFRGCAFLNAAAELGSADPGILDAVRRHKREMAHVLDELFDRGAVSEGLPLALAIDGAIVHAQMGRALEDVLANFKAVMDGVAGQ